MLAFGLGRDSSRDVRVALEDVQRGREARKLPRGLEGNTAC